MRCLIAEDDYLARTILNEILKKAGTIEATEAADGQLAVDSLEELWADAKTPELCILDITMPNMTGLELLRWMRSDDRFKSIPAILCTAKSDRETVVNAAALNISGYIVKPYSEEKVVAIVKKVVKDLDQKVVWLEEADSVCEKLSVDHNTYLELIQLYFNRFTDLIRDTRFALFRGDFDGSRELLDEIRDSSRRIGAMKLSDAADQANIMLLTEDIYQLVRWTERLDEMRSHSLAVAMEAGLVKP